MKTDSQPSRYCLKCRYDLHALPEPRCPECGREFDPDNPKTYTTKKRWRGWIILLLIFTNPALLIPLGWYIHLELLKIYHGTYVDSYRTGWYVSGAMAMIGITILIYRRWSGILLILLNPAGLYTIIATIGYFAGTAHYRTSGCCRPPAFDFELSTRLTYCHDKEPIFPKDWFEEECHNYVLLKLGSIFGRAPGTYNGPVPTKDEAELEIELSGKPVNLADLRLHRVTINGVTFYIDPYVIMKGFTHDLEDDQIDNYWEKELPQLLKQSEMPVATILDGKCILLRVHANLSQRPSQSDLFDQNQFGEEYVPIEYTMQDYSIYLIYAYNGWEFGQYWYGD